MLAHSMINLENRFIVRRVVGVAALFNDHKDR